MIGLGCAFALLLVRPVRGLRRAERPTGDLADRLTG